MYFQQRQKLPKHRKFNSLHKPYKYHLPQQRIYNNSLQQERYHRNLIYQPLYSQTPNYNITKRRTKTIPAYNDTSISMIDDQESIDLRKYKKRNNKFDYFRHINQETNLSRPSKRVQTINQIEQQNIFNVKVWKNPDLPSQGKNYIKIYKIKHKRQNIQLPSVYQQMPVISRIKVGKIDRNKNKQHFYEVFNTTKPSYLKFLQFHKRQRLNKSFRKVAHAVLFITYLKGFNRRMRISRSSRLQQLIKTQLNQNLFQLKSYLIDISRPFLKILIEQNQIDFILYEKDDQQFKKEKIKTLKNLIQIQMQCLQKGIRTMSNQGRFTQILYYFCKHGSFAPSYQIMTNQQLNLSSISQSHGYLKGDKHLQKSGIILLVFIKFLLYNMLLQPTKMDLLDNYQNKTFVYRNIILVGNILYQLFLEVHDSLIQQVAPIYKIGNWTSHKKNFPFKTAQSMTVKKGFYQSKDLISGLAQPKFLKESYKISEMTDYKGLILQLVKLLHENIVSFHQKISKQHY